jgi:hypothetical protein
MQVLAFPSYMLTSRVNRLRHPQLVKDYGYGNGEVNKMMVTSTLKNMA